MTWSIQEVARMSRVTARTLRDYDEIGLLRPDSIGSNGYRYYERAQLLRLQQILLLREWSLDLATIRAVVDAQLVRTGLAVVQRSGLPTRTSAARLLRAGVDHDDAATFAVLDDDLALQRQVWTTDKESYTALAESLSEPSEWRAHMDSLDPRLATYLRDAMLAYANERI